MRIRRIGLVAAFLLLAAGPSFAQLLSPGQKASLTAAQATATIATNSETVITVQLLGTFTATVTFEGSLDGQTFGSITATPINSTTTVTTASATGVWSVATAGVSFVRARVSAYTSGTVIVTFQSAYTAGGSGGGGGGASGNVSITQGGNTAAVNGSSQLSVNCANCSGSGVSQQDNTGFVAGTTNFVPSGGYVDDVGTTPVAEDSAGSARITAQRGVHVNLRTNAGVETGVAAAPLQVSLANTGANATAVKVDGSAVTQPVSGTVTANMGTVTADPFGANADAASATGSISAKLRFIAGTGIPITGTVAVTQSGTWTVQPGNTANSTAWLVTGTGGTFPATQSGTWTVQPGNTANTTPWLQIIRDAAGNARGANVDANNNLTVGSATAANFNVRPDTSGATGSAPPARAEYVGGLQSGATGGLIGGLTVCDSEKGINVSTATTTLMITGVSGRHIRICAFNMLVAAADNVQWISGTGATCGTGTTGIGGGGTTAGSGYNFAANGGIAQGNGLGQLFKTTSTGDSLCLVTSAAVQLSGIISYTIY